MKHLLLLFLAIILSCTSLCAQNTTKNNSQDNAQNTVQSAGDEDQVFIYVEKEAQFPGGIKALIKYVRKNLSYPQSARDNNVEGMVFVQFVVEKNGKVNEVQIIKSLHPDCDAEALRVVKGMPKWKPAKQKGKRVRCQMNLPIAFKLI